jgi:hypothetical protein
MENTLEVLLALQTNAERVWDCDGADAQTEFKALADALAKVRNQNQWLIARIDSMTDEQLEFMSKFIEMLSSPMFGKGEMMELIGVRGSGQVDSAIPLDYQRRIEELHPNFKSMFHCYDYRTASMGEMMNVAEAVMLKASEIFNPK